MLRVRSIVRSALLPAFVATLALGACSSDDAPNESSSVATDPTTLPDPTEAPTTTVAPVEPLRILVTNDDGYSSEGIDVLVEALRGLPEVEITVVAPAENQSGRGDSTTEGELTITEGTTASGYAATAVGGTPADSVNHALDVVFADNPPDLVVSGSNEGQNLGIITDVSGTVGAARTAARRGIPALAISQGIAAAPDFEVGVAAAIDWIVTHRDDIAAFEGATAEVWSINAPTCAVGEIKGLIEIATAAASIGSEVGTDTDCSVQLAQPANDVEAFNAGWITLSNVGLD